MSDPAKGPNAEQVRYWDQTAAPKWVRHQARLDAEIGAIGEAALEAAAPAPGEAALDVGCGCGDTTIALARRVAPDGCVLGLDVSTPMLARARQRIAELRLRGVALRRGDAQTEALAPAAFDLAFSRFGVMFFADPPAAFANLRAAVRPDGRLAFACWRPLEANEWMALPLAAAARVAALPPRAEPGAPGPFSLADPAHVRAVLEGGGWSDVRVEPLDLELPLGEGGSFDEALALLFEIGPTAAALREHEDPVRRRVMAAVREALEPRWRQGALRLGGAAWIASARNPG